MKVFKFKYSILAVISGLFLFNSCSDNPLDVTPPDRFDAVYVFSSAKNAQEYVFQTYGVLPYPRSQSNGYNRLNNGQAMIASASDEAVPNVAGLSVEFLYNGSLSPTSPNPDNTWNHNYQYIRSINIGLENIDMMPEQDSAERDHYRAELTFLRAFAHFELLKRFGGIPIITQSLNPDDNLNIPRNSVEEVITFIVDELDKAIPGLLLPEETTQTNFGRISSGAAMALKSRVLLYAASPLFNSAGYDGSGNPLISFGSASPARWEAAAQAAADVINLNFYQLYIHNEVSNEQPDALVLANGEKNYREFFYTLQGNREMILPRNSPTGNAVEKKNAPVGYTNGEGTTNPSQQMVDAYGMINGYSIHDAGSGYDPNNPYQNRDPRFYASIFYNGMPWLGRQVETFEGGLDNPSGAARGTRTGYYLSKFMNPSVSISGNEGATPHSFPLIRYAEILLNYAEAVNEAFGPDTDPYGTGLTARQAVEKVRSRVMRPDDARVEAAGQEELREAIRAERRVELAFEGHRHLDVRRWMIAEEVLGQNLSGIRITVEETDLEFTQYTIESVEAGSALGANPADYIIDGDTDTKWSSWNVLDSAWIRFDLGQSESVNELRILFDRPKIRGPYPFSIAVGNDPENMEVVWSGLSTTEAVLQAFPFSSTNGRYVEIKMTDANGSEFDSTKEVLSIFEVEIFGGGDVNTTYELIPNVSTREFSQRLYLYPISVEEVSANYEMDQNPGW